MKERSSLAMLAQVTVRLSLVIHRGLCLSKFALLLKILLGQLLSESTLGLPKTVLNND